MSNPVAKVLSYVFHPLLMATYLIGGLFYFAPSAVKADIIPPDSLGILLLAILAYTFVIPVLFVYGMLQLRMIEHITLKTLEERRYPFMATIIIYAAATYFFGWGFVQIAEISGILRVTLGSITVSILLVAIISSFWQISAHMTGIGGVTGFLFAALYKTGDPDLTAPLLIAILASGWIAASRLQLNAHTMREVAAGYVLGVTVCGGAGLLFL